MWIHIRVQKTFLSLKVYEVLLHCYYNYSYLSNSNFHPSGKFSFRDKIMHLFLSEKNNGAKHLKALYQLENLTADFVTFSFFCSSVEKTTSTRQCLQKLSFFFIYNVFYLRKNRILTTKLSNKISSTAVFCFI